MWKFDGGKCAGGLLLVTPESSLISERARSFFHTKKLCFLERSLATSCVGDLKLDLDRFQFHCAGLVLFYLGPETSLLSKDSSKTQQLTYTAIKELVKTSLPGMDIHYVDKVADFAAEKEEKTWKTVEEFVAFINTKTKKTST